MGGVMTTALWIAFFFIVPAAVMWGSSRFKLIDKIGGIVICYGLGIILGNIGVLPSNAAEIQDLLTTIVIPLALPLIFFSMDLHGWRRQTPVLMKAFFGALIAVLLGSLIVFFLMKGLIGGEAWKVAGMLIGCYTGGTPNLAAIGTALNINSTQYVAVHASDVIDGALLLLIFLTVIPRLLRRILPKYQQASAEKAGKSDRFQSQARLSENETTWNLQDSSEMERFSQSMKNDFSGFRKLHLKPLAAAFGLSAAILAVGGGISMIVPQTISTVTAILIITSLGVAGSFVRRIRSIAFTFQLGYYLLLVFSLVVSSMADIRELAGTAPIMIFYVAVLLIAVSILHIIFSKILNVDSDTHLITATALIYSPPFVPVIAAAIKNKEVIMSGMVAGIAGWVIGNYIGIGFAYLLRSFI